MSNGKLTEDDVGTLVRYISEDLNGNLFHFAPPDIAKKRPKYLTHEHPFIGLYQQRFGWPRTGDFFRLIKDPLILILNEVYNKPLIITPTKEAEKELRHQLEQFKRYPIGEILIGKPGINRDYFDRMGDLRDSRYFRGLFEDELLSIVKREEQEGLLSSYLNEYNKILYSPSRRR